MGKGHSEEFVAAREDLGHATGHLLPAIAVLVQNVLGLPVKASEDQRRIAKLEGQLARARGQAKDSRRGAAEVERIQRELAEARAALADAEAESARVRAACDRACGTCRCADPAERVLDVAVGALAANPPTGVDSDYVGLFVDRHRDRLLEVVRASLGRRGVA